ncbi:MAG: CapA family protein [Candidatus Goldbacteria bacterium]|nr:CapA family protein [Candidatus Goldiibacteriota bacterium]
MTAGCATVKPADKAQLHHDKKVSAQNAGGSDIITLTGDIMPGRKLSPVIDVNGSGYPYAKVKELLKKSSVVFGNLEAPLVNKENLSNLKKQGKDKSVHLYGFERDAQAMADAGFDIMSLANNHILDYGQYGLTQTVQALEKAGIDYCGIRKGALWKPNAPCVKYLNGTKVSFLCYSNVSHETFFAGKNRYGTIPALMDEIEKDIEACRADTDILIIYLHWGREYEEVKSYQKKFAKKLIDRGADFIFGSHTHIFQDVEKYKGKYIFYGLGNFVFDLEREDTHKSGIVNLEIADKKINGVKLIPVKLVEYRPEIMHDPAEIKAFIDGLKFEGVDVKELGL